MRTRFLLSPKALFVILMVAAELGFAAPTTEEMLSTVPVNIIGPNNSNPSHDFTKWKIWEISNWEGRDVVIYRSLVNYPSLTGGQNFLITAGHFQAAGSEIIGPTATFIEATRPVELDGGTWEFGYVGTELLGLTSGGSPIVNNHVAFWTWTEDAPVVVPEPDPEPLLPNPIIRVNLGKGLDLGNAVSRAIRGKNPRQALQILERQRRLMMAALVAAE